MSETQTGIYYNGNWYGRSGNTDALDSRITQVSNNIAPRQISNTASKLITVGEYFTDKLGRLCVCDVQIASGGTIVVGGNCHVVSEGLGNELNRIQSSLSEVYTNSETFAGVTNSSGNTLDLRYTTYIAPILETLFSESSGTFVKTGQDGMVLTGVLCKLSNGGDIAGFAIDFDGYYYLFEGINRLSPKYRCVRQLYIRQ